ncbi:hypothetical protein [Pseudogemmobacter bohemicus]|uniref:hypothetical protein n=1 Tax=Pseudogemmobacter bohemicus TaxID=2250708 RepID=UPI000DD3573B|nr:hypothetical protein [Pseudogemmobacter bohemicus]
MLALVAGIALRSCTGALFLTILTWRPGLDGLGIPGTFVMAAATFLITAFAAALAGLTRCSLKRALPTGTPRLFAATKMPIGAMMLIPGLSTALRLV